MLSDKQKWKGCTSLRYNRKFNALLKQKTNIWWVPMPRRSSLPPCRVTNDPWLVMRPLLQQEGQGWEKSTSSTSFCISSTTSLSIFYPLPLPRPPHSPPCPHHYEVSSGTSGRELKEVIVVCFLVQISTSLSTSYDNDEALTVKNCHIEKWQTRNVYSVHIWGHV